MLDGQEATGKTPTKLALGRNVQSPLERLIHKPPSLEQQAAYNLVERQKKMAEEVQWRLGVHRATQAKYYKFHRKAAHFQLGDLVWVRANPLSKASEKFSVRKWEGPATVVNKLGPLNYRVGWSNPPGKQDTLNY